jgi:hypothetical protein
MLSEIEPLRSCVDDLDAESGGRGKSELGVGGDRWEYKLLRPTAAGGVPELAKYAEVVGEAAVRSEAVELGGIILTPGAFRCGGSGGIVLESNGGEGA